MYYHEHQDQFSTSTPEPPDSQEDRITLQPFKPKSAWTPPSGQNPSLDEYCTVIENSLLSSINKETTKNINMTRAEYQAIKSFLCPFIKSKYLC